MQSIQLVGPSRPAPQFVAAPPTPTALEVRMRCELALRRLDRVLGRRTPGVPTTPCWFCGNRLTPDEVGLPCPACGDGNGVATDATPPHVLGALARWRAERDWRTAERNQRWHELYETTRSIENR